MKKFTVPGRVKNVVGQITAPENTRLSLIFTVRSVSDKHEYETNNKLITRWSKVKQDYRERFVNREKFKLGELITTPVASDIWIVQALCLNERNKLDKSSLEACVKKTIEMALYEKAFIHVDQAVLNDFPAINKLLLAMVPPEGLNLYIYNEEEKN